MSAGILSVVSIAKESTWGTAVTPTKSVPVAPSGGFKIDMGKKLIAAIRGQLQKNYTAIPGNTKLEADYTMDAFADIIGNFLLSAHGVDTPALHAGETIVYDHVYSESATKPSYTIEEAISEHCRRYAGAIVTGYKFAGKTGEMLTFAPKIAAKTHATATAITPAFTTVPSWYHSQIQVKIGGSVIGEVSSFELEYDNGVEMIPALGSLTPAYYSIKGGSTVKGKLEMYLDATTLTRLTNYLANTNESLEIIATGGAIGSAANYLLDLLAPVMVYTMADTPITDSHNLLTVDFENIPNSSNQILVPTLTNLVTAY